MSSTGEHLLVPVEALFHELVNSKLLDWFLVAAAAAINHPDGPSATGHGAEVLIALSAG
jgi:hypothetical protein